MSGKGSKPRPYSVGRNTFEKNWDAIFNQPDPRVVEDAKAEDEEFARISKRDMSDPYDNFKLSKDL